MSFLLSVVSWFTGGGFSSIAGELRGAYEARLKAENDEQRLAAELDIARIEGAMRVAELANADRWSATSLGRYLIVLPFGMWWAAIFMDSIFNAPWVVLDIPAKTMELSEWLIPLIVAGDVGKYMFRPRR